MSEPLTLDERAELEAARIACELFARYFEFWKPEFQEALAAWCDLTPTKQKPHQVTPRPPEPV